MNGATVLTKFIADTKDFDKKLNGVSKGLGTVTGSFVKGSLIANGLSKAMGLVSNNMDRAIDRFDTLNNFPKVMKNLGINAKDSEEAIDLMAKKLSGLPTTLDQGAMAVQRFTSKNGDVKKSAEMFLSVNNAILAGGAPTVNQSAALEQLTQAYSRGKFELQEWKSLQMAMPGQLKQVANAMGYVSDSELYDALKEGSVSMDDFINTIIRLNKEGTNGLASFEQQAKDGTQGIRTAITNLNTRVAIGLTKMLESINKGLAKAGLGNIAQVFSNVGDSIKNTLISLAPYITKFIVTIGKMFKFVKKHQVVFKTLGLTILTFVGYLKIVTTAIGMLRGVITVITIFVNVFKVLKTVITAVRTAMILLNIAVALNPIGAFVIAVVALIAIFAVLWKKCDGFRNFWIGLWNAIKQAFSSFIEHVKIGIDVAVTLFKFIWNSVKNYLAGIGNSIKELANKFITFYTKTVPNFINGIINWFRSLPGKIWNFLTQTINRVISFGSSLVAKGKSIGSKTLNAIVNAFKSLPSKMGSIGASTIRGLWNGMKNLKSWVVSKVKNLGASILKGLKDKLGIHSPSTEFALIGKFSVLGFTNQLEKMKSKIQDTVTGAFELSPQLANSSSLNYSPNVINNINITQNQDPLGRMVNTVKTFSGGAKNDYNYGQGVA